MKTVNIDKLEDLNGFEWEYQGKEFFFRIYTLVDEYTLALAIKKFKDYKTGEEEEKNLIHFSLRNLTELEFYGLKVVLNEKPKLRREEREFLEMLEDNQTYIAREDNPWGLRLFGFEPTQYDSEWLFIDGENEDGGICLKYELFPFITWESGKAWSKAELMELEVKE